MAAGETMLSAYRGYELKQLRAEKAAAEANQKNKIKLLDQSKMETLATKSLIQSLKDS